MVDEYITFLDDSADDYHPESPPSDSWKIAIIDDEASVHEATRLALKEVTLYGKRLEFLSAYSAKEGLDLIKKHPDMAVILLDVVMESDNSGLELVDQIRNVLKNLNIQIVLRTGQPGYAPEEEVIIRYDINAYKTKNELTRTKLFTVVATAIRSYQHLSIIEKSRQGLKAIIDATSSMLKQRTIYKFSSGVLKQIDALYKISSENLFCVFQQPTQGPSAFQVGDNGLYLVAASENYRHWLGKDLRKIKKPAAAITLALNCLFEKSHLFKGSNAGLFLETPSGWEGAIVIENAASLKDSDQELLTIFCTNIALGLENAKFFTHLNQAAFYDELTGLRNRIGLIEEAEAIVNNRKGRHSVFIIDIDYFHQIVATLGFNFGNLILKNLAEILVQLFGNNAVVSRIHADVFAIFVTNYKRTASEVAIKCARPMVIENQRIRLGLTVGMSESNSRRVAAEQIDVATLLRQAEMALNVAKEKKRGSGEVFQSNYEDESRKSMTLLNDLRIGIEQNELFLVLQPKIDIVKNLICGFEALVRWQHPKKGLIPPNAFISAVEKSGMNYDLDLYIARMLCGILKKNDFFGIPISFNISSNSLNHENFIYDLISIFDDNQIPREIVEVEVTENALIHSHKAIARLNKLRKSGFNICLDDFGAGFSSLSYLLRLPLDVIKIDRAFVSEIGSNPPSVTLLSGMLNILKNLRKKTVIEGVETEEQLRLLTSLGVKIVQGYVFYKPLSVHEAHELLIKENN